MILFRARFVAKHNENFLQNAGSGGCSLGDVISNAKLRPQPACRSPAQESETHQGGQFEKHREPR